MTVHDHTMLVDEEFFSNLFQLPSEGISNFTDVSTLDIEEIQIKFSAPGHSVKISDMKQS